MSLIHEEVIFVGGVTNEDMEVHDPFGVPVCLRYEI